VLISKYQWYVADPLCSIMIFVLILATVLPFLRDSSAILLQRQPPSPGISDILVSSLMMDGIAGFNNVHLWTLAEDRVIASLQVQMAPGADEFRVRSLVTNQFKNAGVEDVCLHLEPALQP